jgi:hypothetical protein
MEFEYCMYLEIAVCKKEISKKLNLNLAPRDPSLQYGGGDASGHLPPLAGTGPERKRPMHLPPGAPLKILNSIPTHL